MEQTTQEEFDRFCAEVRRTADALQLGDWLICIEHADIADPVNGRMLCDHEARTATIILNRNKGDPALDVLRVARHEVYELLLAPLTRLARSRMLIAGEIEETTHAIIRRLERMPIS